MSQFMVTKQQWDSTTIPQRVINCQFVGLEGKVAGKEWEQLTTDEQLALSGVDSLSTMLGAKAVAFEVDTLATEKFRAELQAGMGLIAGDIVAQILSKKSNMEG